MAKISGPLLDRIDIHIEVPAVPFRELSGGDARHVERGDARRRSSPPAQIQRQRFAGSTHAATTPT